MSFDPVPVLVQALLTDDKIANWTSGRVYGGFIPEGATAPLVLVMLTSSRPSTSPPTQWFDHLVTVEVQAEDSGVSFQIASAAMPVLNRIAGTVTDGVVSSSEVTGLSVFEDGAFTPTRFRNVLSVDMTARDN